LFQVAVPLFPAIEDRLSSSVDTRPYEYFDVTSEACVTAIVSVTTTPRSRSCAHPISGTNDDGTPFSRGDAQTLESFAASNGVAELAFWSTTPGTQAQIRTCGGNADQKWTLP
jgi:hypothetical protein